MTQARPTYQRGQIWMVDLGAPTGHEQALERPCMIVSDKGLVNTAHIHGMLIAVPGTRTRRENPSTGKLLLTHIAVAPSAANGLKDNTYFMTEQVRALAVARFRRYVGTLEGGYIKAIEDRLCLAMSLFSG